MASIEGRMLKLCSAHSLTDWFRLCQPKVLLTNVCSHMGAEHCCYNHQPLGSSIANVLKVEKDLRMSAARDQPVHHHTH